MGTYQADREWSDTLIDQVKRIVGPQLLMPAQFELDANEATDLLVLRARDMRIAARVRRNKGYAERYPYDFTIRCARASGAKTELAKIVDGWGDWMFYGHADGQESIHRWWLIDLHAFRAALIRSARNGSALRCGQKSNNDGTSFKWFDLTSFPEKPPILIAGSHELITRGLYERVA